jgi:hypothetical protein
MNTTFSPRAARAINLFAISAGLVLILGTVAPAANAGSPFSVGESNVAQVLCDLSAIKGQLTTTESRYTGTGTCIELLSPQKTDDKATRTSEFPRVNESTQLFSANWTSQSTYNPVTKETWEKITMPAPATDQKSPVGRPYGNYETRMICATDPWLTGIGVNCTGKTVKATGNLGDAEAMLRMLNRPLTTPSKPAQLQALLAAHDRDARLQTPVTKAAETNSQASTIAIAPKPTIVEPRDGATYPPQTPLRVRIVPAKDAKDTAYRIEIQAKVNFDWRDVITVATTAGVAQSPQGYRGWGGVQAAGARGEMTATTGAYRMRARATAPQAGQPGDWVEFKIDGQPGKQVDPMDQAKRAPPDAGGGAAQSAASLLGGKPSTANALGTAPAVAVKNPANAASLNPQPLPPKTSPGALTLNPQTLAPNSLSGAASLNPQPLPPKTAPGSLTATPLPGGVPQAPSSLR